MPKFEITVQDGDLVKLITSFAEKAVNTDRLTGQLASRMLDCVKENFEQEGRPPWQGLADATIKARRRKGSYPGKILQDTGTLVGSFYTKNTSSEAVVGTDVPYAAVHQLGSTTKNIPARKFLAFTSEDREEFKRIALDFIVEGL